MKLSQSWLQRYLKNPLPQREELLNTITFRLAEVEDSGVVGEDTMIDLKILPDRSHDCLSHRGVARELSVVLKNPLNDISFPRMEGDKDVATVSISIEDEILCRRYVARRIEGVTNGASAEWAKNALGTIGARSINAIVDATNIVMFDIGQPLHAFDADKVVGSISVRHARVGETIMLLDGREIPLTIEHLLIADEQGPLALAGIKGGKRAEVTTATKNIIIESANFEPAYVRRTSTLLNLRNDSSKRFENEITKELAGEAIDEITALILEISPAAKVGPITDIYRQKETRKIITLPYTLPKTILGIEIAKSEMKATLEALRCEAQEKADAFLVTVPFDRIDLTIPEDLVEEIVRIHGIDTVPSIPLPPGQGTHGDPLFALTTTIRAVLAHVGFTETMGYSFSKKGDLEVVNAIGQDRPFMRTNLTDEMKEKLSSNLNHVLFDDEPVKLFDVGAVFPKSGEEYRLVVGIAYRTKKAKTKAADIQISLYHLFEFLKINDEDRKKVTVNTELTDTHYILEISLDLLLEIVKDLPKIGLSEFYSDKKYEAFSPYPRVVRDIALFVSPEVDRESVIALIQQEAGELCVLGPVLFDVYEKKNPEGKIERVSLAYRMVFQSMDRTLTDEEVNTAMERVYTALKAKGFEVRA